MSGLLYIEGPEAVFTVDLPEDGGQLTIGRGEAAQVRLKDDSKQLSREHLVLRWGGGAAQVTVLGKLACTVRGQVMGTGSQAVLALGDTILLGNYRMTLRSADAADRMAPRMPPPSPPAVSVPEGTGGRLRDFLQPPAAAPAARSFTQWVGPGTRPSGGAPDLGAQTPMPGLDAQPRRLDELLERFIQPQSDRLLEARDKSSPGDGVSWIPASAPAGEMPDILVKPKDADKAAHPETPPVADPPDFAAAWLRPASAHEQAPAPTPTAPSGPQAPAAEQARVGTGPPAECLAALAHGLGIHKSHAVAAEDWQRLGATLRLLVDGVRLMLADRKALRSELRVPEPTQFYQSDNNPLKTDMSLDDLVAAMMSSTQASRTFLPFDQAVQEAVDDLRSHNLAIIAAVRATVVGVIQEFDPQRLRGTLSNGAQASSIPEGAPSLLERARLWRAYADRYEALNANLADWIERVFDKHFIEAYSREAAKLRNR